jgi:hypothetical protein
MKRRGESEQPCLSPLSQLKVLVASPLIKMAKDAEEIQAIIQFVKEEPKPHWIRIR